MTIVTSPTSLEYAMSPDPRIVDVQQAFVTGRFCPAPVPLEREFAVLGFTLDPRDTAPEDVP